MSDFNALSGTPAAIIAQARFMVSAAELHQLPAPGPAEVCFLGRSNAGKSSALNVIATQRKLAFVSKTPGRTRLINFFAIPVPQSPTDETLGFLVDLPGYGYAAVAKYEKQDWDRILGGYLKTRPSLVAAVMMVDIRRGLTDMDIDCLRWIAPLNINLCILVTKADKLGSNAQRQALQNILNQAKTWVPGAHGILFSSTHRVGIEAAQAWTLAQLQAYLPDPAAGTEHDPNSDADPDVPVITSV